MRIACPSCAAEYEVPASRLKPGKQARCARCGNNWVPDLETVDDVPPHNPAERPMSDGSFEATGSLPDVTAMDRLMAAAAPSRPRNTRLTGAWVLTFVVLAGLAAAAVGWRDAVVRVWPPSSRILATSVDTAPHPAQSTGRKAE